MSLAEQPRICYTVGRRHAICNLWHLEVKERTNSYRFCRKNEYVFTTFKKAEDVCEQLTIAVSNMRLSWASCRFGNSCQKVTCHVCSGNTISLPTISVKWKTRAY